MSNEQLDILTEPCNTCGARHLDYPRALIKYMWQDGKYHPISYFRSEPRDMHDVLDTSLFGSVIDDLDL